MNFNEFYILETNEYLNLQRIKKKNNIVFVIQVFYKNFAKEFKKFLISAYSYYTYVLHNIYI